MTRLSLLRRPHVLWALCWAGLFLAVPAQAQTITIDEARSQGVGATVTVEGTVTRALGAYVRLQDNSGPTGASAIVIRQTSGPFNDDIADGTIAAGTQLQVSGEISEFPESNGVLQIDGSDLTDYTVQGPGSVPAPQEVSLATLRSNGEEYESELVTVSGASFLEAEGAFSTNTSYTATDGSGTETFAQGTLTVRVQGTDESALGGEEIPAGTFDYTGVVGEFYGQYQLIPVQPSDIEATRSFRFSRLYAQAQEGSGTVTVSVRALGLAAGDNVSVTASVGGASTATLGTDVTGFDSPQTLTFSGSTPAPQPLSFSVVDDSEDEGVERLEVTLESNDGATTLRDRFTLWVLDEPTAQTTIAAGDSGDALVGALQEQYGSPRPLGYDLARDTMYARIYNESNTVEGFYSGYEATVDPTTGDPSIIAGNEGINTEHTWPQSQGAEQEPATSNMHILVPTRAEVNSARSNLPYGDIVDSEATQWFYQDQSQSSSPSADRALWSEVLSGDRFEPRHSVKGDVARAAFYFVTVYPNRANFAFFDEQRETLLEWHAEDPVDATEMRRNLSQASYQGNAVNPFVLDATLADRAYGSGAGGGEDPAPPPGTYTLFANASDVTPSSGQAGVQCLGHRSTGEVVFFNSSDGGIFSWEGTALTEERGSSALNGDIGAETNTINRCDGVTVDANDNVYFLLRADGSSSQNSWPTYVYKLPASGSPVVLASEDGLQSVAHDNGTVYLGGVAFRGAPADGVYSVSDAGEGQTLSPVIQEAALDLNYGMDVDGSGKLYAFSGAFADGSRRQKIVRVTDPSGSATVEEFVDPYRSGSPLVANSGNDISDLRVVNYEGTEYVVVYNASYEAQDGDQWATIQISDSSIELLFNRTDLVAGLPVDGYVGGYTAPMAVDANGDVFVASRTLNNATDYIAKVSDASPLPVELASFDATRRGSAVTLTWQTATETNNARFEVQRRADGGGWAQVGAVEGRGTTETAQAYRFTDPTPPFAADALTYRLRQVDLDGSTSYSAPVTVQQRVERVTLRAPFPNPASGAATVQFAVPERQRVTLRLYDVLGRRVQTLVDGARNGRQQVRLHTTDLSSGVYFLRLRAGGSVQTQRVTVVQ